MYVANLDYVSGFQVGTLYMWTRSPTTTSPLASP